MHSSSSSFGRYTGVPLNAPLVLLHTRTPNTAACVTHPQWLTPGIVISSLMRQGMMIRQHSIRRPNSFPGLSQRAALVAGVISWLSFAASDDATKIQFHIPRRMPRQHWTRPSPKPDLAFSFPAGTTPPETTAVSASSDFFH